ncbi:MAG: Wzt carbohydrate-binding domain-containing protein [Saprospiraceae bacterium]|nr:Wzt carbohydrate-binding domain-containing protein [Candidatus Brachybacter algidus]
MAASVEGSQHGSIKAIQIHNSHGEATRSLVYGEPWSISASIDLGEETARLDARFMITINDQEETNVAQLEKLIPAPQKLRQFVLSMSYDECLFNSGKYFLTASLQFGKKGTLAYVARNMFVLNVKRDISGYAPIILQQRHEAITPVNGK